MEGTRGGKPLRGKVIYPYILILLSTASIITIPFSSQIISDMEVRLSFGNGNEIPYPVPRVSDPFDAMVWVLNHTVHKADTSERVDSRINLTKLLEAIHRRGYAVTYCYGITALWVYVLHKSGIPAFIVIARTPKGLHAFAVAYHNDQMVTFYISGEEEEIVSVVVPYPEDWEGNPLPDIVRETRIIPESGKYPVSTYIQLITNSVTTRGPDVVIANDSVVQIHYETVDPFTEVRVLPWWSSVVLNKRNENGGVEITLGLTNGYSVVVVNGKATLVLDKRFSRVARQTGTRSFHLSIQP